MIKSMIKGSASSRRQKTRVTYVKGLGTDKMVRMTKMDPYYRGLRFQMPGNNNLESFGAVPNSEVTHICLNGEKCHMDIPDILMNCIADADAMEERLAYLDAVIPQLKAQNPKMKVINHPTGIMKTRRDEISKMFQGLKGIIMPKTIKVKSPKSRRELVESIQKAGIKTPFLIRESGLHNGINLTKVDDFSDEELDKLDVFPIDGRSFYVTEFFDFKSADGFYRKARIIMIDGQINNKHLVIAKSWNVHARNRKEAMDNSPELRQEEAEFLAEGGKYYSKELQSSLAKIHKQLGLEIFGLDIGILSRDKIVIFEINTAMDFITNKMPDYVVKHQETIKNNFQKYAASL